jgi:hypothetical protein
MLRAALTVVTGADTGAVFRFPFSAILGATALASVAIGVELGKAHPGLLLGAEDVVGDSFLRAERQIAVVLEEQATGRGSAE